MDTLDNNSSNKPDGSASLTDSPETRAASTPTTKAPAPPVSAEGVHPLLIPDGYVIATRQVERMASHILRNFDYDNHGVDFYGLGRIGKSQASKYLCDQPSWLKGHPALLLRTSIPKTRATGDCVFFGKVLRGMGMRFPESLAGPARRERLVNYIVERCKAIRSRLVILFFDEANRLLDEDYDYIVDLDNELAAFNIRLFMVFVRQLDADGFEESKSLKEKFPSQIVGRFLMESHQLYGLQDLEQVRHALNRYDNHAFWPIGSKTSYTAYWAPVAFERGWRLADHADSIWQIAVDARVTEHLGEEFDWPMKTFTSMVRFLLCNIAQRRSDFREFCDEDIRLALRASGFMQLEFVRARLIAEPKEK